MVVGDISHKKFAQISEMCKNYSKSRGKVAKKNREPFSKNTRGNVPSSSGLTRLELGNLLENFKTDILGAMGSQLDDLQDNMRKEEENTAMSILCRRCRTKNPQREFALNNIFVCHICTVDHTIESFPSLPGLQPYIRVGTLVKHIGGLGNLNTNQPIRIHHHNPHPIIIPTNNLKNGTLQVGRTGHPSTLLLLLIFFGISIGHRDGGDKHIPHHHLYSHLIILILSTHPISNNFFLGLCIQFPLLHNNLNISRIKILYDLHYYLHNG